ncbi:hypothetical protein XA68_14729 [Ophiocordyceps unilateralis]|uniref:Uncharacterized protein n=1 Tax=Ophiocordyceps unilateralis TaxID=268505 RepID=A0A2A9PLF0_OPHUN|nr:hypothetical protein XA68_14729 [Ophiocordyceps unilateralis]
MASNPRLSIYLPGPITDVNDIIRALEYDEALVQQRWERYQAGEELEAMKHVEHRLYIIPSSVVNIAFSKAANAEFVFVERKPELSFFRGLKDHVSYDAEKGLFAFRGDIRLFRQLFGFISKLVDQGLVREAVVAPMGLKEAGSGIGGVSVDGINAGKDRADYEDHIKSLACVLLLQKGPDVDEWLASPVLVKPLRPHLEFRPSYGLDNGDDERLSQWEEEAITMSEILVEKVVCISDVVLAENYNGNRYDYWLRYGN